MALIFHWQFNEGSGTTATDIIASKVFDLDTGASWIPGKVGSNAIRFDGSSAGKAVFNTGAPEIPVDTFTVSYWLNYRDSGDGEPIAGSSYITYIDGPSESGNIYYNVDGHFVSVAHGGFTSGTWYFITIVRNGLSVDFYKDGVQIGTTQTLDGGNAGHTFSAFGAASDGLFPCQCDLDDLRIYDTPFDAAAVLALYNSYTASPVFNRRSLSPLGTRIGSRQQQS